MAREKAFYLPQLDGLRFLAFLAVFIWHFSDPFLGAFFASHNPRGLNFLALKSLLVGASGVDLFFALSAYLITELLLRERRTYGEIDCVSFYKRRALRIWPLYYGALTVISLFSIFLSEYSSMRHYLPWFALFAGNFALCRWGSPAIMLAPLWSVSVEEQFYFVWPFAIRSKSPRQVIHLALALWAVAIGFRWWMRSFPDYESVFNTLGRLDPIAAGALIAAVLDGRIDIGTRVRPSSFVIAGLICWESGFLMSSGMLGLKINEFRPLSETAVAIGSVAFLLAAVKSGSTGILASRPLVYLGKISYGLYIFHGFVLTIGSAIFGLPAGGSRWYLMVAELGATIALAAISFRWFESPFLRLKSRFQRVSSGAETQKSGPSSTSSESGQAVA